MIIFLGFTSSLGPMLFCFMEGKIWTWFLWNYLCRIMARNILLSFLSFHHIQHVVGIAAVTEEVYTKQLEMRDTKRAHDHFQFQFLCFCVCPIKLSYTYLRNTLFLKLERSPKFQPLKISCWEFQCTVCNSHVRHEALAPRIWMALCESFWYAVKHTVTAERWKVDK